jgi:PAS domain S-box-containing protein
MIDVELNRELLASAECHHIFVFIQDSNLHYVRAVTPPFGLTADDILGKTDHDLFCVQDAHQLTRLKRKVMSSGKRSKQELAIDLPSGERRWVDICVSPRRDDDGTVIGVTGSWIDITEHYRLHDRILMLMREVAHRSKNMLAIVQGVANQTAKGSYTVSEFIQKFTGRLLSLGHAQDLLTATDWRGASIADLVRIQLGPFIETYQAQVDPRGPSLLLKSNAAQYLGLALHELVTNAEIHGTLASCNGRVSLRWRITASPTSDRPYFVLLWREHGKIAAVPNWDQGGGFGRLMLMRIAPQAVQGTATMRFRGDGLTYRLSAPLKEIVTNEWQYIRPRRSEVVPSLDLD